MRKIKVPKDVRGRVIDARVVPSDKEGTRIIKVLMLMTSRIQVGDKMSGRHGNKGIVARIFDEQDMPFLPDGTPVDVVLNPLGVPSRMNVGQIFEGLLGLAARWSNETYRVGPFDEMFATEASRSFVLDALARAQERTGQSWLLDKRFPGKTRLTDGRTGELIDQPVTVVTSYMLKLNHLVRDKIHTRSSSGKNSMITLQPMKGRSRGGGLRVGEMEVSAVTAYGASMTIQEMMTVKSDDVVGRRDTEVALTEGEPVRLPQGGTPEGYAALQSEFAAAGLDLRQGAIAGARSESHVDEDSSDRPRWPYRQTPWPVLGEAEGEVGEYS